MYDEYVILCRNTDTKPVSLNCYRTVFNEHFNLGSVLDVLEATPVQCVTVLLIVLSVSKEQKMLSVLRERTENRLRIIRSTT